MPLENLYIKKISHWYHGFLKEITMPLANLYIKKISNWYHKK